MRDTDWPSELPFLAWTESDPPTVPFKRCPGGTWGFASVDGPAIPFDDPRVQAYSDAIGAGRCSVSGDEIRAINEIMNAIEDIENDAPFPRWFTRERPDTVEWLIGENPNHSPTVFELSTLKPAYVERVRRLKERGLQHRQTPVMTETAEDGADPKNRRGVAPFDAAYHLEGGDSDAAQELSDRWSHGRLLGKLKKFGRDPRNGKRFLSASSEIAKKVGEIQGLNEKEKADLKRYLKSQEREPR